MDSSIQIMEKPDWVSWEQIKDCLVAAHAKNRANGINLGHPQLSVKSIQRFLESDGITIVALNGDKVIGTAAIKIQMCSTWYAKGRCGYLCFASVLPEYEGKGIYKRLDLKREEVARERNLEVIYGDTHSKHKHRLDIAKKNQYKLVSFFHARDHYNVMIAKWLNGCPYSDRYCNWRFKASKVATLFSPKVLLKWFLLFIKVR